MPPRLASLVVCAVFVLACDKGDGGGPKSDDTAAKAGPTANSASADSDAAPAPGDPPATPAKTCPKAAGERVSLTAEDGVELAADHYSPGIVGAPGVVLLHMIPPHHDLDNYPRSFIDALVGAGFEVINVNRRGAAGSKGIAEQAYEGEKARLDPLAGVNFLLASPCKVDPAKLVVVGASNGTTAMVDYAAHAHAHTETGAGAETGAAPPVPAALVYLSGGSYTENQYALAEHLDALGPIPSYFAYPRKEAEWNDATQALATSSSLSGWSFHVYEPGGHGTNLFKTDPDIITEIVTWLGEAAPPRGGQ